MSISLKTARRMSDAGMAKAEQMGLKMTLAVLDQGGHIISVSRMDGAGFLSPDIAVGKAYGAAAFRRDSAQVEALAETKTALFGGLSTLTNGRFLAGRGGLPIMRGDVLVGAVAASGGKAEQDEEVARASLAAFDQEP